MSNNELFSEFPAISKAEWLKQISKDLKDKPLSDLEWVIDDALRVSPFVHAEDFETVPSPLWEDANHWEICERIQIEDAVAANVETLEALNGGAEGIQFDFAHSPDWATWSQLLSGIHLDYIGLHFSGKGVTQNPSTIISHLLRLATAQNIDSKILRGSLAYDPVQAGGIVVDWRYLVDLLAFTQESLPLFKVITIDFSSHENPAIALAETLNVANEYLRKLTERGISLEQAVGALQFSVPVGKSYFLEIAKIRAFKLLWVNFLNSWNAPLSYPTVAAHFRTEAYTDDLYTNMIRATTMAMSAVLGGANRLTVLPYDAGRAAKATYPAAFGRRIARNVQHLMKLESALDEVADPAAGSYYIETLSKTLAEKAWLLLADLK
jgi:methylmalonyl-CoA mutase